MTEDGSNGYEGVASMYVARRGTQPEVIGNEEAHRQTFLGVSWATPGYENPSLNTYPKATGLPRHAPYWVKSLVVSSVSSASSTWLPSSMAMMTR